MLIVAVSIIIINCFNITKGSHDSQLSHRWRSDTLYYRHSSLHPLHSIPTTNEPPAPSQLNILIGVFFLSVGAIVIGNNNKPSELSFLFPCAQLSPHYGWIIHILIVTHTQPGETYYVFFLWEDTEGEKKNNIKKIWFPFRLDIHFFYLSPECDQTPFCSLGLVTQPSPFGLLLFLFLNKNTAAFCISCPLCDGVIGLSVLLAAFSLYSETAPPCRLCGGSPVCCVGALCLQDTTLPGEKGPGRGARGGFILL